MLVGVLAAEIETGGYISVAKSLILLVVLLLWSRLLTWIDKDSPAAHLPRVPLNIGMLGGMIGGFFLFFVLFPFWVALAVLLGILLVEMGVYLGVRHQKVGLGDLKNQFNAWIKGFSRAKDKSDESVVAGQVGIIGKKGELLSAPGKEDPTTVAYQAVQAMLTEPLERGMERLDLSQSDGAYECKYYIDGVSYQGPGFDRVRANAAIEYLKAAAGLDLAEKRKPQVGAFKAVINKVRKELELRTAGNNTGEFMRLIVEPKKRHDFKLATLGMADDQVQAMTESIASGAGIVLVTAPKDQGLTSALYGILRAHDAFLTLIHTIERNPEMDLEGITQNKLPTAATADEEAKQVDWVASQEPEVLMVSQVDSPKSAQLLCKFAETGKRVYVGMRAGNTFDAIAAWRKLVGDDRVAMKNLVMVVAGRVMRRLCAACKMGYAPDPETLRKLNLDPERITQLFQARSQPIRDPKGNPIPCEFCHDLRFKGRFGVYETFAIDDDVRQVVMAGGSLNQLKAVFRKQRGRYLQERALAAVEAGETSVNEVLRVMKESAASSPAQRPAPPQPRATSQQRATSASPAPPRPPRTGA